MSARDGYIGRAPGDSQVIIARQTFTLTGVQTNFTFSSGYTSGYLDVYINGVRQINASDYTATDGSTVGLTTYATSGDVLELVAYKAFNLASVNSAAGNFSVGGDLTVSGTSNVGVVTGGTYYGDGSNLSGVGVPGVSTTGHSVFNTINASGIVTAASFSGDGSNLSGVGVPGVSTTGHSVFNTINASGIVTAASFSGSVSFASTSTVPGISTQGHSVFNTVNASGIVTAVSFSGSGQNLTDLPASGDSNDITACLFI